MTNNGTFTVLGINFPDGIDPLGIWQIPAFQTASFEIGESGTERVVDSLSHSVWRIQLSENLEDAEAALESQLDHIEQQVKYLDEIDDLLDVMDPTVQTHTPYVIGSYDPQTVLLDAINALRLPSEAFSSGDTTVDYGALYEQCEVIFNRFRQLLIRHGRIETRISDNLVGLTKIDWNGDFETIWEDNTAPLSMRVHVKSIRLAVASRMAFLRILSIVAAGAIGLAIKASIPGGQFILVPAVYKFVRDMLEEFKKIPIQS